MYQLAEEYAGLEAQAIAAVDDHEAKALADTIEAIKGEIGQKTDAIAALIRGMDAESRALRDEEVRMAERRKAIEAGVERLKDYVLGCFRRAGLQKLKGPRFTVWLQESESVSVFNEELLPEDFVRVKREPDKGSIKDAIKAGQDVPGAALETKAGVRIR